MNNTNKPIPPSKPFAPKQFTHSHFHAKKPKHHFHHNKQKMYHRQEPDRVENLESLQGDIIPNAIEYILSRNFLEDGIPRSDFNLLDSFDDKALPSYVMPHDPLTGVLDHRIETYELKNKFPTCMTWTPNGNRVLVGNSKGKISMIDSTTFSQHELNVHQTKAVKALGITHNNKFMLVGDEEGTIKYFDSNYKEIKEVRPSQEVSEGVKEISFAPTDAKFVTANDKDKTLRIWDLERGEIDISMIHGNDIHCCQWHPYYGLIASGSKDATIKFWDPKSGEELASLINHANSINCIKWNINGNWLLSCARDQSIRMYDLRMVKEIQAFTGIDSEVEVVSWSPFHERLFSSGTKDGTIAFWLTMESSPISETKLAHFTEKKEQEGHLQRGAPKIQRGGKIVELAWNPVGDVLASCGNDKAVKFWGRPRDSTREFQQMDPQQMGGYDQKDVMDNSMIQGSNQY